jgi:hypothetical protein
MWLLKFLARPQCHLVNGFLAGASLLHIFQVIRERKDSPDSPSPPTNKTFIDIEVLSQKRGVKKRATLKRL